ncbi:MAG: hypothetical protein P4N60_14240 [Verrucomicrobiae bacterium]|nr:hypothetical protein [Verrucomicrobiae bacterium]
MTRTALAPTPVEAVYACGPVRLAVVFDDANWRDALHGLLSQYDAPWPTPEVVVSVAIERATAPSENREPAGAYLRSYRLRVDRHGSRLLSRSRVGVWMEFDLAGRTARITVPFHSDWPELVEEVEQQLVLLLARSWSQAGWTPLHAASLIPPGEKRCVLLCAPSGTGKTTLTTAFLRRGWRTLGDDKTLLRAEAEGVVAGALAQRFHLHPSASRWFPEAGNLARFPPYSRWTDKRIVRIADVWSDRLLERASPAGLLHVERVESGMSFEPLDRLKTLNTLLRQVAIPTDPEHARPLVSCIAQTAAKLNSARLNIGHEAFTDPATMERLDECLRSLLP